MSERRRLHHAAVLAETLDALRQLLLPVLVLALLGSGGTLERILFYGAAGVVVSTVSAFVRWQSTRWWVDESGVGLRRGVLFERQTTIPLDRVQAVDTVRGPVQRMFGVVEVRVQAAGGGRAAEVVLKALTPEDATALREQVARRGAPQDAEEAREQPAWRLERGPLVLAALTSASLGVLVPVVAGASQVIDDVLSPGAAERLLPDAPQEVALLALAVLGVAWLLSFLGTLVAFTGFEAVRDGDRLRIRRGIVERREASVPVERVHAVRIVESLLRQPLGMASVRLETAGYADEPATAQTLLPLVRRSEIEDVLGTLLPELAVAATPVLGPPPRALRRYLVAPVLVSAAVAAPVAALLAPTGLVALALVPLAAGLGVARHRAAGWRVVDDLVVLRGRRLARTTTIARMRRLQLLRRTVTPLGRRARLATLGVALSSRREVRVAHLDDAVTGRLLARLVAAASAR